MSTIKHKLLLVIVAVAVLVPAIPSAQAAAVGVSITNTQLVTGDAGACPNLTVTLNNTSGQNQTVLVDFAFTADPAGNIVSQQVFDNYLVTPGTQTLTNFCARSNIPAGNYHYSVGLFNVNWGPMINWYDSVKTYVAKDLVFTQPGDIVLVGGNQAVQTSPATCKPATFAIRNSHDIAVGILVDIALYSYNGQVVGQQVYDNATIGSGETKTFSMSCPSNLSPAAYYYSVGVFTPGWGSVVNWYDTVDTFNIRGAVAAPAPAPVNAPVAPVPPSPTPAMAPVTPVASWYDLVSQYGISWSF